MSPERNRSVVFLQGLMTKETNGTTAVVSKPRDRCSHMTLVSRIKMQSRVPRFCLGTNRIAMKVLQRSVLLGVTLPDGTEPL